MTDINAKFAYSLLDPERRVVDLLVVRLVYGDAVLRFAIHDEALYIDVDDGDGVQRFEPFPFQFAAFQGGGTMEVDTTTLTVPNVELLVQYAEASERTTLADMARNDLLDNAELWRYQVNLKNMAIFAHSRWDCVGMKAADATMVTVDLQSMLGRCVRPCPMTVLQASCNNSLFDARCGRDRSLYTATSTATGGSRTHLTSALAQADNWFALGEIEFEGGLNIGALRTIGKHTDDGSLFWARPLRFPVQAGDAFTVCAGCDKTFDACVNKFDLEAPGISEQRFRGFPAIPPETVMLG